MMQDMNETDNNLIVIFAKRNGCEDENDYWNCRLQDRPDRMRKCNVPDRSYQIAYSVRHGRHARHDRCKPKSFR